MKIFVFTEGTCLMHLSARDVGREERVRQSQQAERSVYDFASYVPVGHAVQKLTAWKKQGATIYYLTSRKIKQEIDTIRNVLQKYHFPDMQNLYYRKQGEEYKNVVERFMPDVLIEDNCESIGGAAEMIYPHIQSEIKKKIKSIVVQAFEGIDHLPDVFTDLK